eukprot:g5512.t1
MRTCARAKVSIYGKKDAQQRWWETFVVKYITSKMGFKMLEEESCIGIKMLRSDVSLDSPLNHTFQKSDWTGLKLRHADERVSKGLYDLCMLMIQTDDVAWAGHPRFMEWVGDMLKAKFRLNVFGP